MIDAATWKKPNGTRAAASSELGIQFVPKNISGAKGSATCSAMVASRARAGMLDA